MECSWKTVLLLVCASLGVQYTAIRSLRGSIAEPCGGADRCQLRRPKEYRWRSLCDGRPPSEGSFSSLSSSRKHILLFATTRSGSSFTGQLFNQHPSIFYVFEPLYHVQQVFTNSSSRLRRGLDPRALLGAYRDLLLNMYTCDLHFLENYIRPEPQDHLTGSFFRRASSSALCSPPVCLESGGAPGEPDEAWCPRRCRTLNLTLASQACLARGHVAIKTVRIPEVQDLRTLSEDPRLHLRIVHLVRDPRGILASRMGAFGDQFRAWKIWNATGRQPRYVDLTQITRTCQDLADSAQTGLRQPPWLRGKYLLVRYEDLALHPEEKAEEIYRFVGLEMDQKVRAWILQNTRRSASPTEGNYKYSTTRDSRATAESWRLRLAYDIVGVVQTLCNRTLSLLGYKPVHSLADLRNLSYSLVEPRSFLPLL
ncbi:carbohydrate sulfotransferase 1-like [Brienomyrus brachyistius]|uniref:carbohydrate sulfotransferase 1-like n=1 Tax=Brienomyrus brachyistius TaxID=42636 RepID=UPI0020B20AF1|nr:carbohydrate sulfotransferase 1-like [Brienomyrus brachyistius]XP_048865714.1 carbohydrate sulfotransferase 1-like [Brienomyrus brachyistius]